MTTLLTYAKIQAHHSEGSALPAGWTRIAYNRIWLTELALYKDSATGETVLAIRGLDGLLDVVGSIIRRRRGYSKAFLRWVRWKQPDTIIGHSGGGGLASWLASKYPVPTYTFNSGRTKFSLENDGSQQTNVWVSGDAWGDPEDGRYGLPLPGTNMELEPVAGMKTHPMSTIIYILSL